VDAVQGGDGNDTLRGGAGDDGGATGGLYGEAGNDVLDGGAGADALYGGLGNDTYIFGRGYGEDLLIDEDATVGNVDRVVFASDIDSDEVIARRDPTFFNDLVLTIDGTSDSLILVNQLSTDASLHIEEIVFADGTVWDPGTTPLLVQGTSGFNLLDGTAGSDLMWGLGGNDILRGSAGNDVYRFSSGYGVSTVTDTSGDFDKIVFTADVSSTNVVARHVNNDLVLTFPATGDSVSVTNYFQNDGVTDFAIEQIKFLSDGSTWDLATAKAKALTPTNGDDVLVGFASDDTLSGSPGNDTLQGGAGSDTYLFSRGNGQETITDTSGAVDVLRFAPDITPDAVDFNLSGNSLVLSVSDTPSGSITINNYLSGSAPGAGLIERIEFADGTVWDFNTVAFPETLFGTSANDVIDGQGGKDTIWGRAGNDVLIGGAASDYLIGEDGDDRLDPSGSAGRLFFLSGNPIWAPLNGTANDRLIGGNGNDTFVFTRLNGSSIVYDDVSTTGFGGQVALTNSAADHIEVAADILPTDVRLTRGGQLGQNPNAQNSMTLSLVNSPSTRMTVFDQFQSTSASGNGSIEEIRFLADGTVWNFATMIAATQTPTEGADNIFGFSDTSDVLHGAGGTDTIEGFGGDDALWGDAGDDSLFGDNGVDILRGGAGNDVAQESGAQGENNLVELGTGNDVFNDFGTVPHRNFVAGGGGADTLNVAGNVIAFNRGDGADAVGGGSLTVSLNEGIGDGDMIISRLDTGHIVLSFGGGDSITIDSGNLTGARLQHIAGDVRVYDLNAIAAEFDAMQAADPNVTQWAFGSSLATYQLATSTSTAIGGDLTYRYAMTGSTESLSDAQIRVILQDSGFGSAMQSFSANQSPQLANPIQDQSATEDSAFSFAVPSSTFSDPDAGDTLTYTATRSDGSALPTWLTFDAQTRTFSGTPLNADVGGVSVRVTATDGFNASVYDDFSVSVANTNDAPVVANLIADQSATEDQSFSFTVPANTFADVDAGDSLAYSATRADGSALPGWLAFDAQSRTFSGTPANGDVGSVDLKVTATDSASASVSDVFTVAVGNTNDAPTLDNPIADQNATEDAAFSFTVAANTFTDVDVGDSLTYSATLANGSALPAWLSFDAQTRTFSGTPLNADVGGISVRVTAIDGSNASVYDDFNVSVANTNDAPVVANPIADQGASEDAAFNFTVPAGTFADVDAGDSVSYSASLLNGSALPAWLSFDANTRTFSGTPANADVGTVSVRVTATDGSSASVSDVFELAVVNTNDAPTVANAIADRSATEGQAFTYTVPANTFADVDVGDSLSYSASLASGAALPSWLTFDAQTRTFSGTPTSNAQGLFTVRVTGTDGANASAFDDFVLNVVNVITGTSGNDALTGTALDDVIYGLDGNDNIQGGAGNDLLVGGTGFNNLDGGDGDDVLDNHGGIGIPILIGGNGSDTYLFGHGVIGNHIFESVDADSPGGDTILVDADVAPSNVLLRRISASTLDVSVISGAPGLVHIGGQFSGSGSGSGTSKIERIQFAYDGTIWDAATIFAMVSTPTSGNDFLWGYDDQNDSIQGLAGNDSLNGLAGNDTLDGGAGNDTLDGGAGSDTYLINSGTGQDTIQTADSDPASIDVVLFGSGILPSNVTAQKVTDGSTYDLRLTINGTSDSVFVYQYFDNPTGLVDEIRFANGTVWTEATIGGLFPVTGTSAVDTLNGTNVSETLSGLGSNDVINGAGGNDTLDGGAGNDTLNGGVGNDTYVVDSTSDVVNENAGEGTDTVKASLAWTLGANLENLTLTGTSNIAGTGNGLDNVLIGNSGRNTLTGGAGNDWLEGGAGNDTLVGGTGDDIYVVEATGDSITENAGEGTDTVRTALAWTLASNFENLTLTGTTSVNGTGNTANNVLTGNSGNNVLTGNAGNDTLDGGAGADTLAGGTGNDTYVLGRGYGADIAQENDSTAGNTDLAQFLSGVSQYQIWFQHTGNDLVASIIGTADKLTVQNWYSGTANHVEQFKTADGKTLLDGNVQNLVNAMAAFSPPAPGQETLPQNYADALNPVIAANWQ
jgi:Ca2+-binding RTX toxin-like protein